MYVSRLTFHTLPGKTQEVEEKLMTLRDWVAEAGGFKSESDTHSLWVIGSTRSGF